MPDTNEIFTLLEERLKAQPDRLLKDTLDLLRTQAELLAEVREYLDGSDITCDFLMRVDGEIEENWNNYFEVPLLPSAARHWPEIAETGDDEMDEEVLPDGFQIDKEEEPGMDEFFAFGDRTPFRLS